MKIKLLALIIAAVVAVGGGTTAAVVANRPESVALNAITGAVEDFCAREEVAPLINVLKEGSVEFAYEGIEVDDEEDDVHIGGAAAADVLSSGSVKGKLYFSKDGFMVEDLSAEYEDMKISLNFFLSEDAVGISETEIIDASLGLVKGEAAEDFEDSIFAFGSDSEYALGEETTEIITTLLTAYDEIDLKEMKDDIQKLVKDYVKELYKIIADHAEYESESDKVKLASGKEKVRVITITIDAEAAANIVADAYEFLCDDDQVVDFLDKYEDTIMPLLANAGYDSEDSLADLYEEALENAEDYIDELVESAEDYDGKEKLVLEVVTPKVGSKLLKFSVKLNKEDVFSVDFGKGGAKGSDKMIFSADGTKVVYELAENSSKKAEASLTIDDEKIFDLEIDKKDDSFELTLADGDTVIKGDIVTKGKTTTIDIAKIIVGEETVKTDISLIIKQKDKMPKFDDNFDRISDITEEDIEGWYESLMDAFLGEEAPKDDAPAEDENWTKDY